MWHNENNMKRKTNEMKTIMEDLRAPLNEVERWWIRRPFVILLSIALLPAGAILGACEMTYKWYKEGW